MGWGGKREGAGRKVGWRKGYSEKRKVHSIAAHEDEWEIIKKFAELVKYGDKKKCETFISAFDSGVAE